MSATATEATRDELIAEYVGRHAWDLAQNRVRLLLEGEDKDVLAKLPDDSDDGLVRDPRLDELFEILFPDNAEPSPATSAESCYLAARILRAIVYHAEYLRDAARHLFELADTFERQAREGASGDA